MTSITEDHERSEYVAGLRALADALERHPDVAVPDYGTEDWPLRWIVSHLAPEDQKTQAQQIVRGLGGAWDKTGTDGYFTFTRHFGGVYVEVLAQREAVCRRVVIGTREVAKTVPTATEEVTVTEDVVEWVCEPLLAEGIDR